MNKNEKSFTNTHISNKNNSTKKEENYSDTIIDSSNNDSRQSLKIKKKTVNNIDTINNRLTLVGSIPIKLSVELGNKKISIKDFLKLSIGSILPLDKKIDKPLNIYINDYLIAEGEIVIIESKYGMRITKIISSRERINKLE
ncbi:Flagellar motor switch protein FliN [Buchnera aphidicola (Tetraneura ulmi)]|uniref:flagellar motor switch protein FliN n=1 Tax=Buchnera aphidicola TaxID=9 RepID=UPI003464D2BB